MSWACHGARPGQGREGVEFDRDTQAGTNAVQQNQHLAEIRIKDTFHSDHTRFIARPSLTDTACVRGR